MTLRDGLKNLRAAREGEPEEQAPAEVRAPKPRASRPVSAPAPTTEKRETFSTRIRPSVRYALKRQLLEMQEQGQKVRMEDVLEALILKYVHDEAFRHNLDLTMEDKS